MRIPRLSSRFVRRTLAVIVTGGLALTISACGSDDESSDTTTPSEATVDGADTTVAATDTTVGSSDDSTAKVMLVGFAFTPSDIEATPGEVFTVSNDDPSPHTFTLPGTTVNVEVPSGSSATVTAPTEAGTYQLICEFHGPMTGTLTVT